MTWGHCGEMIRVSGLMGLTSYSVTKCTSNDFMISLYCILHKNYRYTKHMQSTVIIIHNPDTTGHL